MLRKVVEINAEKCDGCGLCVPSCAEGAITVIDGKAVLAAENLCDGLGACLGECPRGAIEIIEREAEEFDEIAVQKHLEGIGRAPSVHHKAVPEPASVVSMGHGGCPGSRMMSFAVSAATQETGTPVSRQSQLGQWPIQLALVPPAAPYFQGADLLITADCVPFAYPGYHEDFLKGKAVVVGCPKLDDNNYYIQKLTEIFNLSDIRSVTVLKMEVPCCGGIAVAAREAIAASGREIPFEVVTIGIKGEVKG